MEPQTSGSAPDQQARSEPNLKPASAVPKPSFVDTLSAAWDKVDSCLAWLFGLDQSKYQWAVEEYKYRKFQEEVALQKLAEQAKLEQERQDIALSNVESQTAGATNPQQH